MKRRNLLITIGGVSAGGVAITGSGAFTSVEADRNVSVAVSGDANAYLSLSGTGNANDAYLDTSGSELSIDLTGDNSTSAGGSGVNADAVTVIEDLFEVQNQGTQEVELTVTPLTFVGTDREDTLAVLAVPNGSFPTTTLGIGNAETYSLVVDAFTPKGNDPEINSTINFLAEATA